MDCTPRFSPHSPSDGKGLCKASSDDHRSLRTGWRLTSHSSNTGREQARQRATNSPLAGEPLLLELTRLARESTGQLRRTSALAIRCKMDPSTRNPMLNAATWKGSELGRSFKRNVATGATTPTEMTLAATTFSQLAVKASASFRAIARSSPHPSYPSLKFLLSQYS